MQSGDVFSLASWIEAVTIILNLLYFYTARCRQNGKQEEPSEQRPADLVEKDELCK